MLDNGKVRFGVYNGNTVTIDSNAALNDGEWHQVVTTFGASGMKLYVDGQLNATNPNTSAQNYTGYWKLGGDNTWGGNTRHVLHAVTSTRPRSTRKRLTLAEVQNHYAAGGGSVPNVNPTAAFTSSNVGPEGVLRRLGLDGLRRHRGLLQLELRGQHAGRLGRQARPHLRRGWHLPGDADGDRQPRWHRAR